MIGKVTKTLIGILLIPVAIATAKAFFSQVSRLGGFSDSLLVLERGVLVYLVIHVFIMRPVRLYVIAHELVHVLATWLCGGHIMSFNIWQEGGSVVTSKTNVFIELSPYFVPFYTLMLGPVFLAAKAMTGTADLLAVFLFLVGFTLALHFVMTYEVLKMEQPDIAKSGLVLSFVMIFVFNLVLTIGVFCPFFESVSFTSFIKDAAANTADSYRFIYEWVAGRIG